MFIESLRRRMSNNFSFFQVLSFEKIQVIPTPVMLFYDQFSYGTGYLRYCKHC